ncbi:MAG: ribosome biogenesis GTPase Der [Candidatus Alkaliphilus sp. MAG34]|nr:ribosome biogenesis GTPase Der [Clostridiales bacterium]
MSKPIVAIVGRPNVGKSTLFNKILGSRVSIVDNRPGITRDRIHAETDWLRYDFTLIDTGGLDLDSKEIIPVQMRRQAELAMDIADVIIFVTDGREGLTSVDRDIAQVLRKTKKPVIVTLNKVDTKHQSEHFYEYYELGMGEPIEISAELGLGIGDLLDEVVRHFETDRGTSYDDDVIGVAIIGKPNVGKSLLVNRILGEDRVIVSDIAGTTRDAIDTPFIDGDDRYVLIDTAGIRRKSRVKENIERYSVIRAIAAIKRANVCLLVIDATEGVTEQDKKIAGYSHENGKGMIILINKWDMVKKDNKTMSEFMREIRNELSYIIYAPVLFISALTGQRVNKILEEVKNVAAQNSKRVSTGTLNEVIGEAMLLNQPPSDKGRRLRIFYATQVSIRPPTFILFINDKDLMHFSYLRYLENKIRENFGFEGTPIRFILRQKTGRD